MVKIKLTGIRDVDSAIAFTKMKFDKSEIEKISRNFTWHHMDDYNPVTGYCTMQLVDTQKHIDCYIHHGAVSLFEKLFNLKYK